MTQLPPFAPKGQFSPTAGPLATPLVEADSIVRQAIGFHQAGLLAQAEQLYRRAIALQPRHFDSLHLLGVLVLRSARPSQGERRGEPAPIERVQRPAGQIPEQPQAPDHDARPEEHAARRDVAER